jgi:Spy/CpxP family protein refolding chaperone
MQSEGDKQMKKRMLLTTTVIAIAALAIVPFVYAGPGRHARGGEGFGGHGARAGFGLGILGHLGHVKEELDLSDQQVDQLKAIFKDVREQNQPYREQLRGGMKDVAELLLANPNDVAAAQSLLAQRESAEAAMKANVLQATSKALNVLNADQRAKLSTMLEKRAERWQQRRKQ